MSELAERIISRDIYYNEKTTVIFTYYKQWIELDTLILVKLR